MYFNHVEKLLYLLFDYFIAYKMCQKLQLSEALYVGLCRHIGTPQEVTIRRGFLDMDEVIRGSLDIHRGIIIKICGSYREGFRFSSSDKDTMYWSTAYKVIYDMSNFDASDPCTILIEFSDAPPGFVRLKLWTPSRDLGCFFSQQ